MATIRYKNSRPFYRHGPFSSLILCPALNSKCRPAVMNSCHCIGFIVSKSRRYWHLPHSMRDELYVTIGRPSVCPSVWLSDLPPIRPPHAAQGCSWDGVPPLFFDRGTRLPLTHFFWTEIRAKVSPLLQLVTY